MHLDPVDARPQTENRLPAVNGKVEKFVHSVLLSHSEPLDKYIVPYRPGKVKCFFQKKFFLFLLKTLDKGAHKVYYILVRRWESQNTPRQRLREERQIHYPHQKF